MTNADKLTDFAIQKINSVLDLTSKALPTTTKYTLEVTRMDCLVGFIPLIYVIPIVVITSYFCYKSWQFIGRRINHDESVVVAGVFGTIPVLFALIWMFTILANGWLWICIYHPDLYLIHLAIQKVTG